MEEFDARLDAITDFPLLDDPDDLQQHRAQRRAVRAGEDDE